MKRNQTIYAHFPSLITFPTRYIEYLIVTDFAYRCFATTRFAAIAVSRFCNSFELEDIRRQRNVGSNVHCSNVGECLFVTKLWKESWISANSRITRLIRNREEVEKLAHRESGFRKLSVNDHRKVGYSYEYRRIGGCESSPGFTMSS